MKKRIIGIVLCTVMILSATGSMVFAETAKATKAGIFALKILQDNVKLSPMTADNQSVTPKSVLIDGQETEEYEDAVRFQVSIENTVDQKFYLITVRDDDAEPTGKNLKYINQVTSDGGSVVFDVYPSELVSGKTYYVSMSSNAESSDSKGLVNIASFKYFESFTLGDVNDDGSIDSTDARWALQHYVGLRTLDSTQFLAADVNFDNLVDSSDARMILQYYVGLRTSF